MPTCGIWVTVLLIHPALSQFITTTCEIPSVEAGENATVTVHFGQDLSQEEIRDFSLEHISHSPTASQTKLLDCELSYGNVTCDKTSCCTWERHVTDVFRVYIHNVSQELEGRFWGFVIPASTDYQKSCNFSLKASTCRTDTIITTNSQVICKNNPVTIGQTCTVTCNPGHYFQENQTSVTYTCVGKNKWSPEMMVKSCEVFSEQPKDQETHGLYFLFLLLIVIPIVFIFFKNRQARKMKKDREDVEEHLLAELEVVKVFLTHWIKCIKTWYPALLTQTYFLPPIHFNREGFRLMCINEEGVLEPFLKQSISGTDSILGPACRENKIIPLVIESDVRDDRALQRVLRGINELADNGQEKEVMLVVSQLQFGKYLGEPSYAPAAAFFPRPSTLPESLRQEAFINKGDIDILIIHRQHGLFTLQINSVEENLEADLRKEVEKVAKQLNKAENVLKDITSDLKTKIKITKCLVMPNITSSQLKQAIKNSESKQLCECLGAKNVDDAVKLCLLKDQLSDNHTPSDINHSSLQALREWWQHIRASRSGSSLKPLLYVKLVARFCGPATTVEVHSVTDPYLNIRTRGEAVSETGERVARLVLFPEQVDILNRSPDRAFLSGPPGTGKTIVLILQGLTWIQRGYDVHVVSTCKGSRAVTLVIENQLQKTAKTPTARSRVHRHQFDLKEVGQVETAVSYLKSQSEGRQLCVIADAVVSDDRKLFTDFCDQLIKEVPGVYIWGASVYHDVKPLCLEEVKLTTPLRSPPVVVREVMKADEIKNKQVNDYTVSDFPLPIDVPPVMRIKHRDGQLDHKWNFPLFCAECGHEVARVLRELNVGRTGDSNDPPPLQYRDVLVVSTLYPTDDWLDSNGQVTTTASGLVRGLRDSHVPVRVVKEGDEADIRDMALGVSDVVTVAYWGDVQGLERKVVVVESGFDTFVRLHAMSLCTSQLVLIGW